MRLNERSARTQKKKTVTPRLSLWSCTKHNRTIYVFVHINVSVCVRVCTNSCMQHTCVVHKVNGYPVIFVKLGSVFARTQADSREWRVVCDDDGTATRDANDDDYKRPTSTCWHELPANLFCRPIVRPCLSIVVVLVRIITAMNYV